MDFLRYNKNNRHGTGTVDIQPEVLDHQKSTDLDHDYRPLSRDEFMHLQARRGCGAPASHHKVAQDGSIICKKGIAIVVDKPFIKSDSKDTATLTWSLGRPVNISINGRALANNPHTDGLALVWDQEQLLLIGIEDDEVWGWAEVRAI
jgi:hypothetical protein